MKYKVHLKDIRHDWWEEMDISRIKTKKQAEESGRSMVEFYNSIIAYPDELPRTFISAELIKERNEK